MNDNKTTFYFQIVIFSILIFINLKSIAQDSIFLKNNDTLICRISLISDESVFFMYVNNNDYLFSKFKKDIKKIVIFESETVFESNILDNLKIDFSNNLNQKRLLKIDTLPNIILKENITNTFIPPISYIYWKNFEFRNSLDSTENKLNNCGIGGDYLRPFLSNNIESIKHLDHYKDLRLFGIYQMLLTPLFYSFGLLNFNKGYSAPISFSIGTLLFYSGTYTYSIIAPEKLYKSVNIYNNRNN